MQNQPSLETAPRFEFGSNWARFLSTIDENRLVASETSLKSLLRRENFQNLRFLDAGSGSGLFSLAASRLGADVTSFDFDKNSVGCTQELKGQFCNGSNPWSIQQGSLLDRTFLSSLGQFNVVYCWGVAHHTGSMWHAIENLVPLVSPGGSLVLAIYNDQQFVSRIWRGVKQLYQRLPQPLKVAFVASIWLVLFLKRITITLAASAVRLLTLRNPLVPFVNWVTASQGRGMHVWYDLVDWVGGWPFEVAKPEEVFRFMRDRGFVLDELSTSGGHGCNEFVFRKH